MILDIDEEAASRHLSKRERLAIRLVLLLIGMVWPSKYEHQIKEFLKNIEAELK